MKKYFLLSAISMLSLGALTSCERTTDTVQAVDNDTYSVVYDIRESFKKDPADDIYKIKKTFVKAIPSSDVILVYRKSATDAGNTVWQQIPRTLYLRETPNDMRELDYDFDFTKYDVHLKAGGNYEISTTPAYLTDQTFRIVFVPASAGKSAAKIDYSNYDEVVKYYNINDKAVTKL